MEDSNNNKIHHLKMVEGFSYKFNNIFCKINHQKERASDHVIIFGVKKKKFQLIFFSINFFFFIFRKGDIQDGREAMEKEDDEFIEYCHENTVELVSNKFPDSHVWLIQPARKIGSYSSFDHLTTPGAGCVIYIFF